jgi:nitrous oxidase accessory protein
MTTLPLLIAALSLTVPPGSPPAAPMHPPADTLRVGPAGGFRTVRDAVQAAPPGGVVVVDGGIHREGRLVIDRPLELIGVGGAVLDGEGQHQILTVEAEDVTVRGFVLRNVGISFVEDRAAVKVDGGHRCRILENRIEDAFFGIYLARTEGCVVEGNEVVGQGLRETASGNGIHLWYSRDISIVRNRITGHRDGIYLEFVEDTEVLGNHAEDNGRYGLHFMFSDRCRYVENTFSRNSAGVAVMYSDDVVMEGNGFLDNWGGAAYGLLLKEIRDSRISENDFIRNTTGIFADGVVRAEVRGNRFQENGWALKLLTNSMDNRFTGNDFQGNAFDVSTNSRQNYSTFSENYWDAYRGYDLGRDGFGDVPFRPVRLFSLLVEKNEPALILLRSPFVDLLDLAERVVPALTPETLLDERPRMRPNRPAGERAASEIASGGVE